MHPDEETDAILGGGVPNAAWSKEVNRMANRMANNVEVVVERWWMAVKDRPLAPEYSSQLSDSHPEAGRL